MQASELASRIKRRELSPVEVVDAFLDRIETHNGETNAYVSVFEEEARQKARLAERELSGGSELGPLHGVGIAIKDLFDFKAGVRNTFGSKPFADFAPDHDATYVQRLESAGAIILGKTNTPEFGHKGTTDNLLFGPTSTPFSLGKNAGGSSGGSAAAVADGLAAVALGSDGGGSVRIPASFCGVYGFKASFGRVAAATRPNAFGSHTPFIHTGPLSRTVEDSALVMSVIAGPHSRDPLSIPYDGTDYLAAARRSISDCRIAYSPNLDVFPVDERVGKLVGDAVREFESAGITVEEVSLGLKRSQRELCALWMREIGLLNADIVSAFKRNGLDLLGEHRSDLTPEYVSLIESVWNMRALDYKLDDTVRSEVFDLLQDLFERYDLLITPTVAVPPFDNSGDGNTVGPNCINGEEVDPLLGWCLTYPINFTGHPAASVPAGFTEDGLPIGMQIIGPRFADDTVLAASTKFERLRPWYGTYPPQRDPKREDGLCL